MTHPWVFAIFNLGTGELIFIVLLIILLFGANKIPELARSLGRAQKEFMKAKEDADKETPPQPSEDDKIRLAAKNLGISTDGKTIDQLRLEMSQKLQSKPA